MASTYPGAASGGTGDVSPTGNTSGTGPATNPKMRKRTKTGCLTCRKRRIKCGEERPTCANCIKSKRQCEGYNQRVVFKPPIGGWPNHPGVVSTLQYHNSMLPGTRPSGYRSAHTSQPQDTLTAIQPRPMTDYDFPNIQTGSVPGPLNTQQGLAGGPHPYAQDPNFQQSLHSPHHQPPLQSPHHPVPTPTTTTSYFPQASPINTNYQPQYAEDASIEYQDPQRYVPMQYSQPPISYDTHTDQKPTVSQAAQPSMLYQQQQQETSRPEEQNAYLMQSNVSPQAENYSQYTDHKPPLQRYGSNTQVPYQHSQVSSTDFSQGGPYNMPTAVSRADATYSTFTIPPHDVPSDVKYVPQHAVLEQPIAVSQTQQHQPQLLLSGFGGDDHVSPTQVLDEAAIEYEDDDYWDVQSDEEMLEVAEGQDEDAIILRRDFSLIRRIHSENTNELSIRRYDAFIYEGVLTNYKAEQVANPLKNPKTARVFAHFIHVTGPSLSIFERNPSNPTSIFEGPTPPSQQGLWTYILPLKALNNQGLLHAMLAMASLHIARLQRASITPSYKHYAYALKRLGRYLGNPARRHSIPTLATSLLLGFYEVMTAEHVKWSTHLVGAAQLLGELDFRSLTQEARRLKAAWTAQESQFPYQNPDLLIDQKQFDQHLKESAMMPDEGMVSTIVGKKVSYDDFGRVFEEGPTRQDKKGLPGKLDLRSYETLQDLYWWYARQDAFQSMVSGNPLIMDFRKWSDCPPRAPLGRIDALYGSHDHIILLIGRISDFTVRDRERKLKQVEADGGQWRPRPGMPGMGGMGPPPSRQGQSGEPPTPNTPMGPPPHMQGMGPPPGWAAPPPPGFGPGPSQSSQNRPQDSPMGPTPSEGLNQGQGPHRGPPPAAAMPQFFGMAPSQGLASLPSTYANPEFVPHERSPRTPKISGQKYPDLAAAYEAALAEWNSISHAHASMARFLTNTETFAPLASDLFPPLPGGNMTPFGPALLHRSYDISIIWCQLHLANILLLRCHPAMPPAAMMAASICAPATQPYATLIGRVSAGMQMPMSDDTPLTPSLGAALIESTMPLFFAGVQYRDAAQREWLITRLLNIDKRTGWASAGVIAKSCETGWERAASLGKGPPYRRRTRQFGDKGPISLDADDATGKGGWGGAGIVRDGSGTARAEGGRDWAQEVESQDRRFVVKSKVVTPWAMNLLATEEDLRVGMERVGIGAEINSLSLQHQGREY